MESKLAQFWKYYLRITIHCIKNDSRILLIYTSRITIPKSFDLVKAILFFDLLKNFFFGILLCRTWLIFYSVSSKAKKDGQKCSLRWLIEEARGKIEDNWTEVVVKELCVVCFFFALHTTRVSRIAIFISPQFFSSFKS